MESTQKSILDALEFMICESNGTDFSISAVATRANVSPATPYNHFKTKSGMCAALLLRNLNATFKQTRKTEHSDSIGAALENGFRLPVQYTRKAKLYRPLMRFLLFDRSPEAKDVMQRVIHGWNTLLLTAKENGELESTSDTKKLSERIEFFLIGCLTVWANESISHQSFVNHIRSGVSEIVNIDCSLKGHQSLVDHDLL